MFLHSSFPYFFFFRVRAIIKHSATGTDRMTRFIGRIGLLGVLYSVPAWVYVACLVYEQMNHSSWMLGWQQEKCGLKSEPWLQYNINCPPPSEHHSAPSLLFFLIKYLSSLCVGIIAGVWVCSSKTLSIWRNCAGRKKNPEYI